jgi:hypothetical protein
MTTAKVNTEAGKNKRGVLILAVGALSLSFAATLLFVILRIGIFRELKDFPSIVTVIMGITALHLAFAGMAYAVFTAYEARKSAKEALETTKAVRVAMVEAYGAMEDVHCAFVRISDSFGAVDDRLRFWDGEFARWRETFSLWDRVFEEWDLYHAKTQSTLFQRPKIELNWMDKDILQHIKRLDKLREEGNSLRDARRRVWNAP